MSDCREQTKLVGDEEADTGNRQLHDFRGDFSFTLATTPEMRRRAFALRHEVFRHELHYELGENLSVPFENDRHDQHAILCLLTHKASGIDAGCLRIVLTDKDALPPNDILPIEESCGDSLTDSRLHPARFPRERVCEVSRLAVRSCFRRARKDPTGLKDRDVQVMPAPRSRNQSALIGLSLFLAATALVGLSGRRHVFAMMESRFARLLKVSGLRFHKVGDVIDYHGPRAAFYIDQHEAERGLRQDLLPLYAHIKEELTAEMPAALTGVSDTVVSDA